MTGESAPRDHAWQLPAAPRHRAEGLHRPRGTAAGGPYMGLHPGLHARRAARGAGARRGGRRQPGAGGGVAARSAAPVHRSGDAGAGAAMARRSRASRLVGRAGRLAARACPAAVAARGLARHVRARRAGPRHRRDAPRHGRHQPRRDPRVRGVARQRPAGPAGGADDRLEDHRAMADRAGAAVAVAGRRLRRRRGGRL